MRSALVLSLALAFLVGCTEKEKIQSQPTAEKEATQPAAKKSRPLGMRVLARLQKAKLKEQLTLIDERTIRYGGERDGGVEFKISLDNLETQCGQDPEACDTAIQNFVAGVVETIEQQGSSKPKASDLRVTLKNKEYIDEVAKLIEKSPADKRDDNTLVTKPYVAGLFIVYVFDNANTMRPVSRGALEELGLTEKQLHETAMSNLEKALSEELPATKVQKDNTIHAVSVRDSYDASRLFLTSKWIEQAKKMKGDIIAAVPARDMVLFASSEAKKDVAILRELAKKYHAESPYSLTPRLLRFTGKGWEPLKKK